MRQMRVTGGTLAAVVVSAFVVGLVGTTSARVAAASRQPVLVFLSDRDNPPPADEGLFEGIARVDLYALDPASSTPRRLTRNKTMELSPACDPHGARVAYSAGSSQLDVHVLSLNSARSRRITRTPANEAHPSWSPDGGRLVFSRDGDLFLYEVTTRRERRLTRGPALDSFPAWARSGAIAFLRAPNPDEPAADLSLTDATGKTPVKLLSNVDGDQLSWSPDSRRLALTRHVNGHQAIWILDTRTRRLRKLTEAAVENPQSSPAWSPDGKTIAFAETAGIATAQADGSGYRQLQLKPLLFPKGGGWVSYHSLTWCR